MAKQAPALVDPRLTKAHEHPIRIDILRLLREGPSSPARISRRLENVSLNLVSHHMKVLRELGCVELVETIETRGAKEHIYRAAFEPVIDDSTWAALPPEARHPITASILRMISGDVGKSLQQGRLEEMDDNHMSRSALKLDEEGWSQVGRILERALEELLEAGEESMERLATSGEAPLAARVAIMQFTVLEEEG